MRTFCNSFLAVLIISALFWGNCFSCPQILQSAKHSCCHKTKQASSGCQTQVLKQFVKAEATSPAPPVIAGILPVCLPVVLHETWSAVSIQTAPAPPGSLSLRI